MSADHVVPFRQSVLEESQTLQLKVNRPPGTSDAWVVYRGAMAVAQRCWQELVVSAEASLVTVDIYWARYGQLFATLIHYTMVEAVRADLLKTLDFVVNGDRHRHLVTAPAPIRRANLA